MIPRDRLEHGAYYAGICRNATIARWDARTGEFTYWRTKLGDTFTESIGYWVEAKPGEDRLDEFGPAVKLDPGLITTEIPLPSEEGLPGEGT